MEIFNFSKIFKNQSIKPFLFLFFVISIGMFYAFSVDKQLCADGIHYFILILKNKTFTSVAPSRLFANNINQWPIVLGISLGIKNIDILSWLFALGSYFPFIFTLGISLFAIRGQNKEFLLFFIAGILCINIPTDFIIVGEHEVLTLLSWPILFILIRDKALSNLDGIILLFLLILFADLYETSVIISAIFLFISFIRLYYFKERKQRIMMTIAIIISILSIIYNLHYILHPRDIKNVNFFLYGIAYSLVNVQFVFSAFFVFFFTLNLILRSSFLFRLNIVVLLMYVLITFVFGYTSSPAVSFGSRTLTASFLPFLLLCTFIFKRLKLYLTPNHIMIFTIFTVIMISGDVYNSY